MYDAMEVGSGDYPEQKEWEATVSFVDQYNWIKQICKIAATAVQYLQRNKTILQLFAVICMLFGP